MSPGARFRRIRQRSVKDASKARRGDAEPVLRALPARPAAALRRAPSAQRAGRLRRPGADPVDPRERCEDEARGGAACAPTSGFRSVSARPRGRRAAARLHARARARRVTVDVFQHSAGRRVLGERRVARFRGRRRGVTWRGRRGGDGLLLGALHDARCPAGCATSAASRCGARGGRFAAPAGVLPARVVRAAELVQARAAGVRRAAQPLARDRLPARARRARHGRGATRREDRDAGSGRAQRGGRASRTGCGCARAPAARRPRGAADGAARRRAHACARG